MQKKLPPQIPSFTSVRDIPRILNNPIPVFEEYISNYGSTFSFKVGGSSKLAYFSIDPAFHQHVLQKKNRNFIKSDRTIKWLKHYIGDNLLTTDGTYWLNQRRLIQPGFHKQRLAGIFDIMQNVIDEYFDQLKLRIPNQESFDLSFEMMALTFKIVARSLFSTSMPEEDLILIGDQITSLQHMIVKQIRAPFLNFWHKMSGAITKHERIKSNLDQTIYNIIDNRKSSFSGEDDLLQMLLEAIYEDTGEGMSNQQLLDETKVMFAAGHETSANALSWVLYLLAKHPNYLEMVKKEANQAIIDGQISFEQLRELEFTTQVIHESMRLFPPAWLTDRRTLEEDEIIGYNLPKGAIVLVYIYGTHRSPSLWTEPNKFRPERFAPEAKKTIPSYAYLPFGGGPRMCIGSNFAMMEMQLLIAKFVKEFDIELLPNQEITPFPLITLKPKNGIKVKISPNLH